MPPLEKEEMQAETTPTDGLESPSPSSSLGGEKEKSRPSGGGETTSDTASSAEKPPANEEDDEEKKEDDANASPTSSGAAQDEDNDDNRPAPAPAQRGLEALSGFYSAKEVLDPSFSAESAEAKGKGDGDDGDDAEETKAESDDAEEAKGEITESSGDARTEEGDGVGGGGDGCEKPQQTPPLAFDPSPSSSSSPPPPYPLETRQRSESRDLLAQKMTQLRRRRSLTAREFSFLEQLVVHGNDTEVEMARTKLADADLFFERNEDSFGVGGGEGEGEGDYVGEGEGEGEGDGVGADIVAATAAAAVAVAAQQGGEPKPDPDANASDENQTENQIAADEHDGDEGDAVNVSLAVNTGENKDAADEASSDQSWMDTWVRQSPTSSATSWSPNASPAASLTDNKSLPPPAQPYLSEPEAPPRRGVLSAVQTKSNHDRSGTSITAEPQTSVVFGRSFAKSKPLSMDGLSVASSFLDDNRSGSPPRRDDRSMRMGESSVGASEEVEVVLEEDAGKDGGPSGLGGGGRTSPVGRIRDKRGKSIGTIKLDNDDHGRAAIAATAAAAKVALPQDQDVSAYNSLACASTSAATSPLRPRSPLKERRQRSQSIGSGFSALSMGSAERRSELENRRRQAQASAIHGSLWRAHESGLALTKEASLTSASVKNATRRTLSASVGGVGFHRRSKSHIVNVYGGIGGVPASARRSSSVGRRHSGRRHSRADSFLSSAGRDSFLSSGTLELLEQGGPTHREGESAVFRREEDENAIFRSAVPPVKTVERERVTSINSNGGRTVSSLGTSDKSNSSSGPAAAAANLNISALNLDEIQMQIPNMPVPGANQRVTSSGSRVTFADENQSAPAALEDEKKEGELQGAAMKLLPKLPPGGGGGGAAAPSALRRSSRESSPAPSSSSAVKGAAATSSSVGPGMGGRAAGARGAVRPRGRTRRSVSTGGRILLPPSMQQGPPGAAQVGRHHRYVRSESQVSMDGSLPSLHHGRPLRSDSILSGGGGQSARSLPSIRHAHPLRSDSILSGRESVLSLGSQASIPAIMRAHHLRSESVLSARSLASVPSLRPGRPVRSDSLESSLLSFGSNNDLERLGPGSRAQSPDVAAALAITTAAAREAEDGLLPPTGEAGGPAWSAANHYHPMPPRPPQQQPISCNKALSERPPMPPPLPSAPQDAQDQDRDSPSKPVLMRRASRNVYGGEGIEVTEMDSNFSVGEEDSAFSSKPADPVEEARKYQSMVSMGGESNANTDDGDENMLAERDDETRDEQDGGGGPVNTFWLNADESSVIFTGGGSFDEGADAGSQAALGRRVDMIDVGVFGRELKRSLSDEQLFMQSGGGMVEYNTDDEIMGDYGDGASDDASWDLTSNDPDGIGGVAMPQQDAWNVLKDEYAVGYGAGGAALPFLILGTSADDVASHPHVLSPPLMESLQCFLPYAVSEDNFWMKFSLVRDGASLHTLLQTVRGAAHTIIAMETVGGEVFGSFTSAPWRKNWNYFGTGESFLWRMRENRRSAAGMTSVIDQAQLESELDVYPWTGENNFVQLCTHDKIAVGGGAEQQQSANSGSLAGGAASLPSSPTSLPASGSGEDERKSSWEENGHVSFGFGLAIDSDLLHGTSSPCLTFGSPSLCKSHADGSPFEILNMEVWTLTPCISVEEAEKLELGRLFLDSNKG